MSDKPRRKPAITISKTEHAKLTGIAESMADRFPDDSEELLSELDRARIVADASIGADVVRIGSHVEYQTDTGEIRTITLVFPGEADISKGKVSVLTPIGTALIGLAAGQSMSWTARDGRNHKLTVVKVTPAGATTEIAAEQHEVAAGQG